ncbi:PQQ-dependent sugar dehydrogenase [Luteipulveratus halotolerans]|uniref:PQQ-dependent sugar dehydrogenase n=1 Tax=Luteipulveratus halotolerans TaxID=1631356 RepID=UPI001E4A334D|nr:PQQ-dependent sugar dehydrogenase [Luteipulveratus halotolerans]
MLRTAFGGLALVLLTTACTDAEPRGARTGSSAGASAASSAPSAPSGAAPAAPAAPAARVTVAQDLEVPWGLAFLPDGSALVTLRDKAEVLQVRPGSSPVTVGSVEGVTPDGEAGLLGIAVSPEFASDRRVFVYYTTDSDNRVERFTLVDGRLQPDKVVVSGIPRASFHDGGRLAFGPDRRLYIGTGDAGETSRSQDLGSLGGKILRVDQDGRAPADNPVAGSPVWSRGHRNVQGLAWDAAGRMYASEFGQNTWDELNLIRKGGNYGWPQVEGKGGDPAYVDPLVQWPTSDASPSGLAIGRDGAAYVAALAGRSLWRVPLTNGTAGEPERLLEDDLGRIRTVAVGPDGRLWVITSNTFRGSPGEHDDRVIVMTADALRS